MKLFKSYIYFVLVFWGVSSFSQVIHHHIPLYAEDQGPDLPQVGSSMFDKVFSKTNSQGQTVYDLPFPLKKLMKKISNGKADILHTMLPFSRSLQRPRGDDYDPLLNPRLVFSVKSSPLSVERSKLFMGYVKQTDQLEVISYNDEAGRYEYQLVKNYSQKPKVFYVNRGKCLSCHQGQAPIFSIPGWQDTNTSLMGGLIAAKLNLEEKNEIERRKLMGTLLFGEIPSLDAVGNFDALVRESNEINLDERIWLMGCGESNECRLGLLLSTLAPTSRLTDKYFSISRRVILGSQLAKQNLYHSFLSSSDIGAQKVIFKYKDVGEGSPLQNTVNSKTAILEIIGNIYKLKGRDNPATLRKSFFTEDKLLPKSLSGFTFEDINIVSEEIENIDELLVQLYKNGHKMFQASAINKPWVMMTLLERVKSQKAASYAAWVHKKTPEKKLFQGTTIPVFREKVLNVFARYCHQCHATGLRFPPQFLMGEEGVVVEKMRALKEKLKFKLENRLMPPSQVERHRLERSGDHQLLLDYVKSL